MCAYLNTPPGFGNLPGTLPMSTDNMRPEKNGRILQCFQGLRSLETVELCIFKNAGILLERSGEKKSVKYLLRTCKFQSQFLQYSL